MTTIDPTIVPDASPLLVGEMSSQSLYDKCWTLARNLWWTWHPEVISLFRDLDPIRWRQLDHNPVALLREFTPERLAQRAAEMVLYSRINYAHRRLKEYMANRQTWAAWNAGVLGSKPVAYFSAEFGLHESIRFIRAASASFRAITSKAPAVWASIWSPLACSMIKAISSSSSTTPAGSTRNTSTPKSRTCQWSRPSHRRASRSRFESIRAPVRCLPRCG